MVSICRSRVRTEVFLAVFGIFVPLSIVGCAVPLNRSTKSIPLAEHRLRLTTRHFRPG